MNKWYIKLKNQAEFKLWAMKELDLSDKNFYDKYIEETTFPTNVWSANFAHLWTYTRSKKLYIFRAIVKGMLVTFILTTKGRLYLPCLPYGKASLEKVVDVLITASQFCFVWNQESAYNYKSTIIPINSNQIAYFNHSTKFKKYFTPLQLTGIERIYSIPKLVNLTGKDFSRLRYKLNKFKKSYPNIVVREYNPKDFEEMIRLYNYWEKTAGTNYNRMLDYFYFEDVIKYHKELDLLILVVEWNNEIIGMISGGILPNGQAWGFLTKFINDYQGLSEMLAIEMLKAIHKKNPEVELFNVGSDLGSKGLATAKEKFRPVKRYKRYALFFKK